MTSRGPRAPLRATYADSSGTLLATVGTAVMPSTAVATQTFQVIHDGQQAGVRTVSFPGTISSQFGDGQRTLVIAMILSAVSLMSAPGALLAAGKLARLSATARSAQVSSAAHFGSPPAVADAGHRSTVKIAAFTGIIAVGVIVLLVALVLATRRHRGTPVPAGPPSRRHPAPI